MRIAIVAPLVSPIREDTTPLGGAQAAVGDLCRWLAEAGHAVTLLAADGSRVLGVRIPSLGVDARALTPASFSAAMPRVDTAQQTESFARVRAWLDRHVDEVDVVHAHAYDAPCFRALWGLPRPVVHTLHLPPLDPEIAAVVRELSNASTCIAVSQSSADQWERAGARIARVIPPGLDLAEIPFRAEPGSYLLFAGRITPEKGVDHALDVATAADVPLVLAGDIYDGDYYAHAVEPHVTVDPAWRPGMPLGGATYIGPLTRPALLEVMAHASALLMPSTWDEPFGLVGIEAQATGTPVIAYRRGGLEQVVANGETGWLVPPDDRAGLRAALGRLSEIDRRACRIRVAAHFSRESVVAQHEALYREIVT